jgi:hypothetical protein
MVRSTRQTCAVDERDEPARDERTLLDALRDLPLLDEVFLGMQAMNVALVDSYLEVWETQLLQEYMERERTPVESTVSVSAFSQMWVFAVYELLRTWRQRVREILKWVDKVGALDGEEREAAVVAKRREIDQRASEAHDADVRWQVFERALSEPAFVEELQLALNRTEIAFRHIEAVRMTLAKHELPRQDGMFAGAPGYGRIDMGNGSISWPIELGGREITILARRDLADALRTLTRHDDRILPFVVQKRLVGTPYDSYGINRLVLVLDDGTEVPGVYVLWGTQVGRVEGHLDIPFDVARVVDFRRDATPEGEQDEADFPF